MERGLARSVQSSQWLQEGLRGHWWVRTTSLRGGGVCRLGFEGEQSSAGRREGRVRAKSPQRPTFSPGCWGQQGTEERWFRTCRIQENWHKFRGGVSLG